jgi:hypothetical protein
VEPRVAKRRVNLNGCQKTRKSAKAAGKRQRFLHDYWFASEWLIIRRLLRLWPDWFKSTPRNQFLYSSRCVFTHGVCVRRESRLR